MKLVTFSLLVSTLAFNFVNASEVTTKIYDFNISGSTWATLSMPIKNHVEGINEESMSIQRRVLKIDTDFITERLVLNTTTMYNTKFEEHPLSLPLATAKVKLYSDNDFHLGCQFGRSSLLSGLTNSISTPKSRGSGIAPFSYNDNGFEKEVTSDFIQLDTKFYVQNSDFFGVSVNHSSSEVKGKLTSFRDVNRLLLEYNKGSTIYYATWSFFDEDLTYPELLPFFPYIQFKKEELHINVYSLAFETMINKSRLSSEVIYFDKIDYFLINTDFNTPLSNSICGTIAFNYSQIDFPITTDKSYQIQLGTTYSINNYSTIIADISYIRGILPLSTLGQAVLPFQKDDAYLNWGLFNLTYQFDF